MHNVSNHSRSRRATAQEREQKYSQWLSLYQKEVSPNEIMDELGITEAQFKSYMTRAICSGDTQAVTPKYRTCRSKDLPPDIRKQLEVDDKALVKIEVLSDGGIRLSALKSTKKAEIDEIK